VEAYKGIRVLKIRDSSCEEVLDLVAVETRVSIAVNGRNVLGLYCTPTMVRELVVGLVHNEGLIEGEWCAERISMVYGDEIKVDIPSSGKVFEGERTVTSGCAGGIKLVRERPGEKIVDNVAFHLGAIKKLYREFQQKSDSYRMTGGVHSAALSDAERMLIFSEDIGRHNAVDKAIGYCLLENIPFKGKMMMVSGRLSSEIILKCARCAIPVLISRAAPTTLAVKTAEAAGLTLIGFMRGERMNVYTGMQRIMLEV
jgi:FdhD protein